MRIKERLPFDRRCWPQRSAWAALFVAVILAFILIEPAAAEIRCDGKGDVSSAAEFLQSSFARLNLPGAAAVLIRDGQPTFVTFGTDANGEPMSADTRFYIGSLSKAFTAAAVLQLVESRKVGLDAPVQTYLPEFRTLSRNESLVTVRQLLNHTSGLANDTYAEWSLPQPHDLEAAVARLQSADMATPGTRFSYHNPNYTVLARLVEKVSGVGFADYLRDHIFLPSGMASTKTVDRVDEARDGAPRGHIRAFGHLFSISSPGFFVNGAGGVLTTPRDFSIWMLTQLREGQAPNGFRMLTASSVRASHTPGPNSDEYGFGWNRRGERVSHSGGLPNHAAYLAMEGCNAVAVLAPVSPVTAPLRDIGLGALAILADSPASLPERSIPWLDYVLAAVSILILIWTVRLIAASRAWAVDGRNRSAVRTGISFSLPVAVIVAILVAFPWLVSRVISWSWIWLWFYLPMVVVALFVTVLASSAVVLARIVALLRRRGHVDHLIKGRTSS